MEYENLRQQAKDPAVKDLPDGPMMLDPYGVTFHGGSYSVYQAYSYDHAQLRANLDHPDRTVVTIVPV